MSRVLISQEILCQIKFWKHGSCYKSKPWEVFSSLKNIGQTQTLFDPFTKLSDAGMKLIPDIVSDTRQQIDVILLHVVCLTQVYMQYYCSVRNKPISLDKGPMWLISISSTRGCFSRIQYASITSMHLYTCKIIISTLIIITTGKQRFQWGERDRACARPHTPKFVLPAPSIALAD